jgi:uncharacterized protein YecE (DUF72 family)
MIQVGTSGYVYSHWRGVFYPSGLPPARWLWFYAQRFGTVELNGTFYRLPHEGNAEMWAGSTPPGFRFAAKGSRFLTHMKKLRDAGAGLERFCERIRGLGRRLQAVLWQLPPQLARVDLPRLEAFLVALAGAKLPRGVRHAFEFRSAEWYTSAVADLLDRHGAAFCEHDLVARPVPRPTGGWRYLRFHGSSALNPADPRPYHGQYGEAGLVHVAEDLAAWAARGGTALVYFNNDLGGHAVADALTLRGLLGEAIDLHPQVPPMQVQGA